MKVHLLLAAQAVSTDIIGKNPIVAKTASRPTDGFATTQPRATGMRETKAPAVPTKSSGPTQKIGLSGFAGIIYSMEISFWPTHMSCSIP